LRNSVWAAEAEAFVAEACNAAELFSSRDAPAGSLEAEPERSTRTDW
jgi:hypothetical protein